MTHKTQEDREMEQLERQKEIIKWLMASAVVLHPAVLLLTASIESRKIFVDSTATMLFISGAGILLVFIYFFVVAIRTAINNSDTPKEKPKQKWSDKKWTL